MHQFSAWSPFGGWVHLSCPFKVRCDARRGAFIKLAMIGAPLPDWRGACGLLRTTRGNRSAEGGGATAEEV